jgi:hypothetical protein
VQVTRRGLAFAALASGALAPLSPFALEWRFSEGKNERMPAFARELLALDPELIVAHYNEAIFAINDATSSVPVVMCTG